MPISSQKELLQIMNNRQFGRKGKTHFALQRLSADTRCEPGNAVRTFSTSLRKEEQ